MAAWLRLAWLNRERLLAAARALHWPIRTWVTLGVFGALLAGLYWAATTGHLIVPAGSWPRVQWVVLVVNVVGFVGLYLLTARWFRAQDELRDELDLARSQIDDLRVALHEHGHEVLEDDTGHVAKVLHMVDHVATDEFPRVEDDEPAQAPPTQVFQAVRAAPMEGELPTVARDLGGRTFNFRQG